MVYRTFWDLFFVPLGKDGKKKELIKNLDTLYAQLQRVS